MSDCSKPNTLLGNLLVEQVKALHRVGIRAPVQVSVGWDQHSAVHYPEWLQIPSQPRQHSTSPSFYSLCLNTPYRDLLRSIVEEVINILESARYEGTILFSIVHFRHLIIFMPHPCSFLWPRFNIYLGAGFDGILFDVVADQDCSCQKCLAGVRERNGNPDNLSDRTAFGARLVGKFREELSLLVKKTFQMARYDYIRQKLTGLASFSIFYFLYF